MQPFVPIKKGRGRPKKNNSIVENPIPVVNSLGEKRRSERLIKNTNNKKRTKTEFNESIPPVPKGWFDEDQRENVMVLWCARKYGVNTIFYHEKMPRDIFVLILAFIPSEKDVGNLYNECSEETGASIGKEIAACDRFIHLKQTRMLVMKPDKCIGIMYLRLAHLYRQKGNYEKCLSCLNTALFYLSTTNQKTLVQCFIIMMYIKADLHDWSGVEECIKRAESFGPISRSFELDIETIKGRKLFQEKKFEESLKCTETLLNEIKDEYFYDKERIMGNLTTRKINCLVALEKWKPVIRICQHVLPDEKEHEFMFRNKRMAIAYCMLGNIDKALSLIYKVRKMAKKNDRLLDVNSATQLLDKISGVASERLEKKQIKWV